MKKLFAVILSIFAYQQVFAAVLMVSPSGTITQPSTSAWINECRTKANVVECRVTSPLNAVQSNISSATVHSWAADRALTFSKNGSLGNTTRFETAGVTKDLAFTGTGRIIIGGKASLKEGTHTLSRTLALKSGAALTGTGIDKTILQRAASSAGDFALISNEDTTISNANIYLSDMTLDGNKANLDSGDASTGFYLENVSQPIVERVKVINSNNTVASGWDAIGAAHFENCTDPVLRDSIVNTAATEGARFRLGKGGGAFNVSATGNGYSGVATDRHIRANVAFGTYSGNGRTNVSLNGFDNRALNVTSKSPGSGYNGIQVGHQYANHNGDADGTHVVGCLVENAGETGIGIRSSKNVLIKDNKVKKSANRAIWGESGDITGLRIEGNEVTEGHPLDAIVVSPTDGVGDVGQVVAQLTLTGGGSGYTTAPTVSFSGGGGTGATATATISGGAVNGLSLVLEGKDYTSAPTVVFTGGGGTGATATATLAIPARDIKILNNKVYRNDRHGIYVLGVYGFDISGNEVFENGQATPNPGIAVAFSAPKGARHGKITNNRCYDLQASPTQTYGIFVTNSAANVDYLLIDNNEAYGNLSGQIQYGTGANIIQGNNLDPT